jgi:hypothetical protein
VFCLKGIFEWMLDENSVFLLDVVIVVAMGVKVNVGVDSDLCKALAFGLTLRAVLPNLSTISLSN